MKKGLLFLVVSLFTLSAWAQKPNFSLVGFGTGTVGGTGGTVVNVSTYEQLAANVTGTDKKILKITGKISAPGTGVILDVGSNKSLIGVGSDAFLSMINLHLKNSQQIIIQNIRFSMIGSGLGSDADIISIETTSSSEVKYIWIDHCEFFNIKPTLPESAAKKDLYDGMIDIKKSSSLITISWNYFHDHWKCSLIGYTSDDVYDRKITYHHNYFKDIKSRAPSYRGGTGHIYNNFFDGLNDPNEPTSDGVNSREKACLKTEGNYFRNYSKTIYCALEDVTYEGFAYGSNNTFENSTAASAATCSSFTPSYNYSLDKTEDIPGIVASWSGVGKLDAVAYTLTTGVTTGQGSFVLEPAGGTYPEGTSVTITPVPASGYNFVSWNGAVTGSSHPASLVINSNKTVNATFGVSTDLEEENASTTLFSSFPSPISSMVQLKFYLPESGNSSLIVKDNMGRNVLSPTASQLAQGDNLVSLDMSGLPSGVYYAVLHYGTTKMTRVLVKE